MDDRFDVLTGRHARELFTPRDVEVKHWNNSLIKILLFDVLNCYFVQCPYHHRQLRKKAVQAREFGFAMRPARRISDSKF